MKVHIKNIPIYSKKEEGKILFHLSLKNCKGFKRLSRRPNDIRKIMSWSKFMANQAKMMKIFDPNMKYNFHGLLKKNIVRKLGS